ncbi:MAG: MTH938/NDUFAF3 family protein [Methylovirgula sp.]|nr:MTH938/NDUFAF3 family protein [Methylovirgula sp.]
MRIDATQFGSITIDGKTYDHDVVIGLSGKVLKRHKKLSKEKYGTSHIISQEEAADVFNDGCEELIIGTGQADNVRLSPEAQAFFDRKACHVILQPTPEAIQSFNQSKARKIGLMHVTC